MSGNNDVTTVEGNVINYTDFDINKLDIGDSKKLQNSAHGRTVFLKYENHKNIEVAFPQIPYTCHGIPEENDTYQNDSDRAFFMLPLDDSIPEVKVLIDNVIMPIEKKFSSDEMKQKIIGKQNVKDVVWHPFYRVVDENDEKYEIKKNYPPSIRIKIPIHYVTKEISLSVFIQEYGSNEYEHIDKFANIDSLMAAIPKRKCDVSMVVEFFKCWVASNNKKYNFQARLVKILVIETEPRVKISKNSLAGFVTNRGQLTTTDDNNVKNCVDLKISKSEESGEQKESSQQVSTEEQESQEATEETFVDD